MLECHQKSQTGFGFNPNKDIDEAYAILRHTPRNVAAILEKMLKSAESNAVNNNGLNRDNLYVAECYATQGPTLKRIRREREGVRFVSGKEAAT